MQVFALQMVFINQNYLQMCKFLYISCRLNRKKNHNQCCKIMENKRQNSISSLLRFQRQVNGCFIVDLALTLIIKKRLPQAQNDNQRRVTRLNIAECLMHQTSTLKISSTCIKRTECHPNSFVHLYVRNKNGKMLSSCMYDRRSKQFLCQFSFQWWLCQQIPFNKKSY